MASGGRRVVGAGACDPLLLLLCWLCLFLSWRRRHRRLGGGIRGRSHRGRAPSRRVRRGWAWRVSRRRSRSRSTGWLFVLHGTSFLLCVETPQATRHERPRFATSGYQVVCLAWTARQALGRQATQRADWGARPVGIEPTDRQRNLKSRGSHRSGEGGHLVYQAGAARRQGSRRLHQGVDPGGFSPARCLQRHGYHLGSAPKVEPGCSLGHR